MIIQEDIRKHTSPGIYKLQSTIDNRLYIGSATSLRHRCSDHKWYLNNGHYNSKLRNFYSKYGEDSLEFIIIEEFESTENLIKREQYYIDFYDSVDKGFNICPKAGNTEGHFHSEETKRKIGAKTVNRVIPKETRDRMILESIGRHSGEKHPNVKFTEEQVVLIKKMSKLGYENYQIRGYFKASTSSITNIIYNNRWKYLPKTDEILILKEDESLITSLLGSQKKYHKGRVLDWGKVDKIRKIVISKNYKNYIELGKQFGVTKETIYLIVKNKIWKQ